jgi:glycine/D-amino acid oxidase-like deaminating enzyme
MRACIVGGGLAGTLLAWRLAQCPELERVDLLVGADGRRDATRFSGGVVRAYEPHPLQRRLAIESLSELRESDVLRRWSRYREIGSVYLRASGPGLLTDLADVEAAVPGSVHLAASGELAELGWAGLSPDTVGVLERCAGYLAPTRLRGRLLADLYTRPAVTVSFGALEAIVVAADGRVTCTAAHRRRGYDVAVLAAGAWTPSLLVRNGFDPCGLRTKSIQYTVHRVEGLRPPPFVDETTGLYGRPTSDGGLLLGLATQEWDVPPGRPALTADLHREAARMARNLLPHLALLPPAVSVSATDCYCDPPGLSLRPVSERGGAVWTFTGGSGGSAKTALAASRLAAEHLVRLSQTTHVRPFVPKGV